MSRESQIRDILTDKLSPEILELTNESGRHHGHAGDDGSGESHFNLFIVSETFEGHSRVSRQRQVYELLEPLFVQGLHALSVRALTPSEYKKT